MLSALLPLLLTTALATEVVPGVDLREVEHAGHTYRVVTVDLRVADLELYGQTPGYGDGIRSPNTLQDFLAAQGRTLVVSTNAGIFDTSYRPLGLHVERGVELHPLDTGSGYGNFYLKPNGVFWIDRGGGAHVDATPELVGNSPYLATQSGPLLLLDGEIPSVLRPDSPNLLLRSGVGVSDGHTVHLVISDGVTRFYELAEVFRDHLGCSDALYLDGVISQFTDPTHPPDKATDGGYAGLLAVSVPAAPPPPQEESSPTGTAPDLPSVPKR